MKLTIKQKKILCQLINEGGIWVNNDERGEILATIKKSGLSVRGGRISAAGDSQYFYMD